MRGQYPTPALALARMLERSGAPAEVRQRVLQYVEDRLREADAEPRRLPELEFGEYVFVFPELAPPGVKPRQGQVVLSGQEAVELLVRFILDHSRGRAAAQARRLRAAIQAAEAHRCLETELRLVQELYRAEVLIGGKEAAIRTYDRAKAAGTAIPAAERAVVALQARKRARLMKASPQELVRRARRMLRALRRLEREEARQAQASVEGISMLVLQRPKTAAASQAPMAAPTTAPQKPAAQAAPTTAPQKPAAAKRQEKKAVVKTARDAEERRQRERKLRRAAKEAARRRAAVRRGVKEALRRKKAATLRSKAAAPLLPQISAAVQEALRWGVLPNRDEAGRLIRRLHGRDADAAVLVEVIERYGLHHVVEVLAFSYDGASDFDAVVRSASDGGRDAERRLLEGLRQRGLEVHVSRKADRKAGVDAFVIVNGVGVCLQLTTMSWWAATTPTTEAARKRLENGREVVGPAVSKVQKDLEKFSRHYGELPYLVAGVNVRMPFTPEQYVDDVLRLLYRQASEGVGARVAFIAAPGLITYEEVVTR